MITLAARKLKSLLRVEWHRNPIQESDLRCNSGAIGVCKERSGMLGRIFYARSGNAVETKFYQCLPLHFVLHPEGDHRDTDRVG